MSHGGRATIVLASCAALAACAERTTHGPQLGQARQAAWTPLAVELDPLVRMPGTQPGGAGLLEAPKNCGNCHGGYNAQVEPSHNWKGSMMAQAARDFLFWACLTVAGQDSAWAVGRPNAVDLCERCHFPKGWLEGRSEPPNASAMTGADFDGVQCDTCHKMYDPHYEDTFAGTREGADWAGYWDEASAASQTAAAVTRQDDSAQAAQLLLFNGNPLFAADRPAMPGYTEAATGQYFVAASAEKRASFQDAGAKHSVHYSRFHKSRYFCASCHDVSNPALANLALKDLAPGDKSTVLPSEQAAAHAYYHVERTFSEFMSSAYGKLGGADGVGPFAPGTFATSRPGNRIASCQDCHMRDVSGVGCNKTSAVDRPLGSAEHPQSGQPLHDLTGGNVWVSRVLASTVPSAANYDPTNAALLGQGAAVLTLDLTQGEGIDAPALLAGVSRAEQQLKLAAAVAGLAYDGASGALSFRVQNHTGHKLISGFPEGRRMFVNVQVRKGGALIHEVNPYDAVAGTLKGLPASQSPSSPALGASEVHRDELVYEMHPTSTLTGETKTFHFVLATGRHKDNRIPPRGFDLTAATARLAEPVVGGAAAPGLYTAQEYAGGYDEVTLSVPAGADQVVVSLYYQVTSREYVEFLRDEIQATPGRTTLPAAAYIVQSDPFFAKLKAWGDVIWKLWEHNKDLPGAAPFLMAQASVGSTAPACDPPLPTLLSLTPGSGQVALFWSDEHAADPSVVGYSVYYDQAGKSQLLAQLGQTTLHTDTGLVDGQVYCYKVAARYAACESAPSNVRCATPTTAVGTPCSAAAECASGHCVDGMCCDTACGAGDASDCQACSLAAGGAADGVCGPVSPGAICRAGTGPCDPAERCTGIGPTCPADAWAPDGTLCAGGAGQCASGGCVGAPPSDGGPLPDQSVPSADAGPAADARDAVDGGPPAADRGVIDARGANADAGGVDGAADRDGAPRADRGFADRGADRAADVGGGGCACALDAAAEARGVPALALGLLLLRLRRRRGGRMRSNP